jgi:hypothetical protein
MADLAELVASVKTEGVDEAKAKLRELRDEGKTTQDTLDKVGESGTKSGEGLKKGGEGAKSLGEEIKGATEKAKEHLETVQKLTKTVSEYSATAKEAARIARQNPAYDMFSNQRGASGGGAGAIPPAATTAAAGGEGGGAAAAATALSSIPPLATAAVGALVLVGAAIVALGVKGLEAQRDIDNFLNGLGRASGVTAHEFEHAVTDVSAQGAMLRGYADEVVKAMLATGNVSVEQMGLATTAVRGFATTFGVDLTQATKMAAALVAAPGQELEKYAKTLGAVSAAELDHVKALEARR